MKKKSKWIKWQIGGGVTLVLSLILNTVRTDPAFALAQQKAMVGRNDKLMDKGVTRANDPVMEEFNQGRHRGGSMENNPKMNHTMPSSKMQGTGPHTNTRWS